MLSIRSVISPDTAASIDTFYSKFEWSERSVVNAVVRDLVEKLGGVDEDEACVILNILSRIEEINDQIGGSAALAACLQVAEIILR